jgi:hypothetical protein
VTADDPGRPATIDELLVGDDPADWERAGFHVDPDGACRIGSVRVRLVGSAGARGIVGWSLRDAPAVGPDLDGIPTTSSSTPPPVPARHPCGALSVDHVVILTPDGARTATAIAGATGLPVKRTRDTERDGIALQQRFLRAGEVILEVVSPAAVDATDDRPARVFGLALTVADIDALAELYGDALGRVRDAVQPGRRIATLRTRHLGLSTAVAFMSTGSEAG